MAFDLASFKAVACRTESAADGALILTADGDPCFLTAADKDTVTRFHGGGYLVMDVENLMETNVALAVFFWDESAPPEGTVFGEWRSTMMFTLGTFPGLPTRLALDLRKLDGQQLFLDRTPGRLKSMARGPGMRPESIRRVGIGIVRSEPGARVVFRSVRIERDEPDYALPDRVVVDELGQWATREWEGKTHGLAELTSYLKVETDAALAALRSDDSKPGVAPGRSRWGGFTQVSGHELPPYEATGYFRTDHTGERHILVDPDGHPFFSIGLDCVDQTIQARVDGIEKLFAWLPPREGELADLWYDGSSRFPDAQTVDFLGANLRRGLGPEWFKRWAALTEHRLTKWRFNTIGNWSSARFIEASRMPYVVPLRGDVTTEKKIFRDFPDVFSAEYRAASERHAAQLSAFEGDPRLVGYFIMNEPHWAFVDSLNVAEKLLANPDDLTSKEKLIEFLSERYAGDPAKLSSAWSTDISSFADLRRPIEHACSLSGAAARDLDEFNTILIRTFAKEPCEAAKRADPHHLNLGMRYAWISQPALYATGESFDVFSINRYAPTAREPVDEIGRHADMPVMIGEFHHGALDGGLPSNGIRGVRTQSERAEAYRYFMETTAASPYAVGVHYFTLNDQAILGRFDGENFQIGIVDICQRPYPDFAAGVTATNEALVEVILGGREPTSHYPEEVTVGF